MLGLNLENVKKIGWVTIVTEKEHIEWFEFKIAYHKLFFFFLYLYSISHPPDSLKCVFAKILQMISSFSKGGN